MKSLLSMILFCTTALSAVAQFAPPVGQAGSTAIHKDSSIIVGWASSATLVRGYRDISNPSLGLVTFGDSLAVVNKADAFGVASLGDGGSATLGFTTPIVNGPGPDFAVFENAFVDTFLELAFVEVSSDGVNFFRFPSTSNTQDSVQVGSFGALDATKINNLAGKYLVNYGTPFDLEELKNINGLDVNHITHVKIIDVVGCIIDSLARYDQNNNKINDPWRTDFETGGFDLDAVAVINTWPTSTWQTAEQKINFKAFPNPIRSNQLNVSFKNTDNKNAVIKIYDWNGRTVYQNKFELSVGINNFQLKLAGQTAGIYLMRCSLDESTISKKIIIQ